jgi:periplasmic copper chaperone A
MPRPFLARLFLARLSSVAFAFAAVAVLGACSPAPSGSAAGGGITVVDAWTNATPPGADVGAGYMTIRNGGSTAVRLTGGESPASRSVEVHSMAMDNGVMTMRPVEGGLEIPAGGAVELKPGGLHLMLVGLQKPLVAGESVKVTLTFDSGLRVDAALAVRGIGGGHDH